MITFRESRLGKVWGAVSAYGLRAGLQDVATSWLRKRMKIPFDVVQDFRFILTDDRPACRNAPDSAPLKINWLLPSFGGGGGGGLFNIFRTIEQLEDQGHEQRIYITGKTTMSASAA